MTKPHTWPPADRRRCLAADLAILTRRGVPIAEAARRVGISERTAYRLLGMG